MSARSRGGYESGNQPVEPTKAPPGPGLGSAVQRKVTHDRTGRYRPRHAKFTLPYFAGTTPEESQLADALVEMSASLVEPKGRHRRGATNWHAYRMALAEIVELLEGAA